uniref:Uncharacterized protein n=1 Tax=Nelumbo nucifera TaxID=4432 RepID=A0A822XIJ6_NELNU|nr:TPA_asm: hypothetical protein HUJ06_022807 [Nelumbo nucifera]
MKLKTDLTLPCVDQSEDLQPLIKSARTPQPNDMNT